MNPQIRRLMINFLSKKNQIVKLAIPIFLLSIQGCIGATAMTYHAGIRLKSEHNKHTISPEFKSLVDGYSSVSINDPGKPMWYNDGEDTIQIKANCYKETLVSFSPSFVIPTPPVIPLFIPMDGVMANGQLDIYNMGCHYNKFELMHIESKGEKHIPIKVENCHYKFELMCTDLGAGGELVFKKNKKKILIDIEYRRILNITWFWLGA